MFQRTSTRRKLTIWSSIFVLGAAAASLAQAGGGQDNPFWIGVGCGVYTAGNTNPKACNVCCGAAIESGHMEGSSPAYQACISVCEATRAIVDPFVEL